MTSYKPFTGRYAGSYFESSNGASWLPTAEQARKSCRYGDELEWPEWRIPARDGRGKRLHRSVLDKRRRVVLVGNGYELDAASLVWLMHTGHWPQGILTWRNRVSQDLRFKNLIVVGEPDVSDLI